MADWYAYSEGRERGPFDLAGLAAYLRTMDPTRVYVRREGDPGPRPVHEVRELASQVPREFSAPSPGLAGQPPTAAPPRKRRSRGLTKDFEVVAKANARLRVVHLDSVGGRLGEGRKLFQLIRARGLDTYVSARCLSACTLAFAGGRQRYLLRGAVLGFHRGAFPGAREDTFDAIQNEVFTAANFDEKFIRRALSTPNADAWYPPQDILVPSHVITGLVNGDVFAVSGLGANITRQTLADKIAREASVFEAIRQRFPAEFDSIVDAYLGNILKGSTRSETVERVRGTVATLVMSLLPTADDDVIIDYNKVLVEQYNTLYGANPSACYAYASAKGTANVSETFSRETQKRELDLEARVVQTAAPGKTVRPADIDAIYETLRKAMLARGDVTLSDISLLGAENLYSSKHAPYCRAVIAFLREIGNLPPPESAAVMRAVFAERENAVQGSTERNSAERGSTQPARTQPARTQPSLR